MSSKITKLNIPLDICYGSLSFFTTVLHNIFLLYHVDMFVSVYKIDKTSFWVGEIVFLIWNSLNDPLFGWLSDHQYLSQVAEKDHRTSSVVLKRLHALRWNGPMFALAFLSFWIQWTYPSLQFLLCLCLYDGFLTMIDLHHSALLADLAVSAEDRTKLNSRSSLFSIMGSASVFLSYIVWNKENLASFRLFCAILAIGCFLGFWLAVTKLKSTYQNSVSELTVHRQNEEKSDTEDIPKIKALMTFIGQLVSQKNFWWFAAMNLIQVHMMAEVERFRAALKVFHCHFNSNFFPLFLENLLGDDISPGFGSFLIGISFVAPHVNNLYFLSLCRRYGVYAVIRLLFSVKLLIAVVMSLAGPGHVWILCLFIASNRVFTEGTCKLLNLVISDLVDEDFVLHHRHQPVSALMFGTAALLSKPGQTLAPLIGTWLLAQQTGHDIFQSGRDLGSIKLAASNLDLEKQLMYKQGCFNLLVYVPIICALVQIFVWMQFSLHGRRLQRIKSVRSAELEYFV